MENQVNVLGVKVLEGIGRSSKQPYKMDVLSCAVPDEETGELFVAEFILPRDHEPVTPGRYVAETRLARDQAGRLVSQIYRLVPRD